MRQLRQIGTALLLFAALSTPEAGAAPETAPQKPQRYTLGGKPITQAQYNAIMAFNQSFEEFKNCRYKQAEAKLREALLFDDRMVEAHCNLGLVLTKLGQPDEAMTHLQEAVKLNPNRSEAWATMAGLEQARGRLPEAVAAYREFIKRFPNDALIPKARILVTDLETELKLRQRIADSLQPGQAVDDYVAYATDECTTRWNPNKMPLKVYLPCDQEAAADNLYRPEYRLAMRDAFQEWQTKSQGLVAFQFVSDSKDCDIDCAWTNDPSKVSKQSERGEAKISLNEAKELGHVQIVILTKPFEGEMHLSRNLVYTSCLHEIGHALGIMGHSPETSDAMFCSVSTEDKQMELTARDANTLRALYKGDLVLKYNFRTAANNKVALNNEGVDLATNGDVQGARSKFAAAFALDNNYEPARKNLASIHYAMAIESHRDGDLQAAETHFKKVISLQENEKDLQRKATVLRNYARLLRALNKLSTAATFEAQADRINSPVTSLKDR